MDFPERKSWNEALLLLSDAYAIVLVGPRVHTDWRRDVIPLMTREARDPRDWDSILPEEYERSIEGPFFPFSPVAPEELDDRLYPVSPDSAASLLVAMSCDDSFDVSKTPGFAENRQHLMDQAHTLLQRFLPAQLYTNSAYARSDPGHDYLAAAASSNPYVTQGLDLGLIAVTRQEVGLFWSIDAR